MRKTDFSRFTPLMRISLILTTSIVCTRVFHGCLDSIYWLVAALVFWGISLLSRKAILQGLLLYSCLFCVGCHLTSRQMDNDLRPAKVMTGRDLSSFDKTILAAQGFRDKISQRMQALGIKGQDYAVIAAMTLGDKAALSKDTKEVYSISGASHILAVSGLHIGIIFQFFVLLMGGKRRSVLTVSLSLVAIWMYVLFIGMPASAIRSATMISICCYALVAHKEALSVNNLCFAYVVMLLVRPLYLFDISFQMSFLAVFSILLWIPSQRPGRSTSRIAGWCGDLFRMSLAAQIGTMPLIVYYFGRISCYSLLTSFIAIPAATFILYLSVSAILLAPFTLIPHVAGLTTPLLHAVASSLVGITQTCNTALRFSSMLPGASIEGIKINIPQLCLIYVSIVMGIFFIQKLRLYHFR